MGAFLVLRSGPRDDAFEDVLPERVIAPPDRYVAGQILVGFTATGISAPIRSQIGVRSFEPLPLEGIELWSLPDDIAVPDAVDLVRSLPGVRFAEPNLRFSAAALPNDPKFPSQWGLHNTGRTIDGKTGKRDADVDVPEAWDESKTRGSGALVAVIDSGAAYGHRDIAPSVWTNAGESGSLASNGVDDDGNGYVDDARGWDWVDEDGHPSDPNGHGTHGIGTIAARAGDGTGIAGVSPAGKVVALRVLDAIGLGASDSIARAIVYAGGIGADVANLSIVGPRSETVLAAIASVPDMVVVAAAGNDGLDLAESPTYPCGYEVENLICIGASDSTDALAAFSNHSGPVDITAPGDRILSTSPSFVSPLAADFETDSGWSLGEGWSRLRDASGYFISAGGDPPTDSAVTTQNTVDLTGGTDCTLSFFAKIELGTAARAAMEAELGGVWTDLASFDGSNNGGWKSFTFGASTLDGTRARFRYTMSGAGSIAVDDVRIRCLSGTARAHEFRSGTSMAAPFVSGVAALLRSLDPTATPAEVISAVTTGGDPLGSLAEVVGCGCRLNARGATASLPR